MKKIIMAMAAALMVCSSAMAQRQRMTDEERAQRRAEMVKEQADRLAKELDLKDAAKTAFVEAYTKYQNELQAVQTETQQQRNREETKVKDMTDEQCFEKIKDQITRQEQQIEQSQKRLEITKKYLAEFLQSGKYDAKQLYMIFGYQARRAGQWNGQGGQGSQGGFGGGRGGFGGGQGGGRGGRGGGF